MPNRTKKVPFKLGLSKSKVLLKKSRGQHLLQSVRTVNQIVTKTGIFPTDVVLEIGPGTGNLTMALLQKAKRVIAIEIDPRLIVELKKRVLGTKFEKKLQIIQGDALKTEWPFFNLLVANIPYQISSPLVNKLIEIGPSFRGAVIMLQKEFAERLYATPGTKNYAKLSANTQLFLKVEHLIKVPKKLFKPPPKVDSAVVRIEPIKPQPSIDKKQWNSLLSICFHRKNKTLSALFLSNSHFAKFEEGHERFCAEKQIKPIENFKSHLKEFLIKEELGQKRAAKISIKEFKDLLQKMNENKIFL